MNKYRLVVMITLAVTIAAIGSDRANRASAQSSDVPLPHPQIPLLGGVMVTPEGNFTLDDAQRFTRFPLYFPGATYRDLPLNAIVRVAAPADPDEPVRADHVTFMYGSCESIGGGACAVPLQVQVWNPCERNQNSYIDSSLEPSIVTDEALTIRDVQAAFYENFTRLELYTPEATIVLFTDTADRQLLLDAAEQLRGVNVNVLINGTLSVPLGFDCTS